MRTLRLDGTPGRFEIREFAKTGSGILTWEVFYAGAYLGQAHEVYPGRRTVKVNAGIQSSHIAEFAHQDMSISDLDHEIVGTLAEHFNIGEEWEA